MVTKIPIINTANLCKSRDMIEETSAQNVSANTVVFLVGFLNTCFKAFMDGHELHRHSLNRNVQLLTVSNTGILRYTYLHKIQNFYISTLIFRSNYSFALNEIWICIVIIQSQLHAMIHLSVQFNHFCHF